MKHQFSTDVQEEYQQHNQHYAGEHIDYEGYAVLPMALPYEIILGIAILSDDDNNNNNNNKNIQQNSHDWSDYFWCGYKGAWLLGGGVGSSTNENDDDTNNKNFFFFS